MIANHFAHKLSDLDLLMAAYVPPGGNWRDIPEDVPSERLAQIRVSAAAGEGSRSTYYGRLHPDRPAYTINTYFCRPGNGCFLHYDVEGNQNRTLSHREAARLQSFPDTFKFTGSQRAVCQQIGNAVPPLLSYQVALALGEAGAMMDVFAGAGGLSLGFEWAGWRSLSSTDNDRHSVATFNANMAPVAFLGDMNDDATQDRLVAAVDFARRGERLALVGGPPCQGFSTGGNRRSGNDLRNILHGRYAALLARLQPDLFVFENVLGLLSLDEGAFLQRILQGLRNVGYEVTVWRLNAARFGVPQRRERVFIVGVPLGREIPTQPIAWTSPTEEGLFTSSLVSGVAGALGDLPPLAPGQDGSSLPYRSPPESDYQKLMRGKITPADYIARGRRHHDSGERRRLIRRVVGGAKALHPR
jgi:DNA (cytosine-5)-methyltransferase 1